MGTNSAFPTKKTQIVFKNEFNICDGSTESQKTKQHDITNANNSFRVIWDSPVTPVGDSGDFEVPDMLIYHHDKIRQDKVYTCK